MQQFDQLVEGIGGYGGQCATPPHILAPTTAFSDQLTAMRQRIAGLESAVGFLSGGPFTRTERHRHLDEIVNAIVAMGGHRAGVFELLLRVLGLRDLDAWAASRAPLEVTDGDLTLRAWWSDEERCWWAGLTDAKADERPVKFGPISFGSTREDALAHLSIATYLGLMEDPVPDAAVEAVARNFVTEFATQCGDLDTFLTLADRMALVRAGMALAIGTEPATHATPREALPEPTGEQREVNDEPRRTLTDGSPVTPDHRDIDPLTGQQKAYVVLSAEERAKGFVRPVRDRYLHLSCGTVTTMGRALAETYARQPDFYSGTFCCGCGKHFPVGADGEFVWAGTDVKVGT